MGEGSRPVRSPPEEKSRLGSPPPPNVPSPLKVESGTSKKGQISPGPVQKSLKFGDSERKDEKKTTSIQQQEASAEKERGNDHFKVCERNKIHKHCTKFAFCLHRNLNFMTVGIRVLVKIALFYSNVSFTRY